MAYLDCETISTTMNSLSQIYGVSRQEIGEFFASFDIEKHYEINDPNEPAVREIRKVFENEMKCKPKQIDRVYWFHLTRTLPENDFSNGISPLSESLGIVWQIFFRVFEGSEYFHNLKALSNDGVPDCQFVLKADSIMHAGPYAMLVRDVAFNANTIGHHDYLQMPEIMEDICNGYEKKYGVSLHHFLKQAIKPKIVKFWSKKRLNMVCIESALYYAYLSSKSKSLNHHANTCFDGGNVAIPSIQITKVEEIGLINKVRS